MSILRELLGPSAQIDVYEQYERVGGRVNIVELNGHTIESGGTIIHDSNRYMVNFTDILGMLKTLLSIFYLVFLFSQLSIRILPMLLHQSYLFDWNFALQ